MERLGPELGQGKGNSLADTAAARHCHNARRCRSVASPISVDESGIIGVGSARPRTFEHDRVARRNRLYRGVVDSQPANDRLLVGIRDVEAAITFFLSVIEDSVEVEVEISRHQQIISDGDPAQLAAEAM